MPLSDDATACSHCTLVVPVGLQRPEDTEQFCCHGCRTAYALIHDHGLQAYYGLPDRGAGAAVTGDRQVRYAELDRPAFLAAHTTELPGGQRRATLGIDGIHCAACLWLLERLPRVVPGVITARVDWRRATIEVRWSASAVALSTIANGIAGLGYRPHPLRIDAAAAARRLDDRRRMVGIAVAFAAAGNNMLIALSLYLGLFSHMDDGVTQLLRWASCVVGVVSLAWPGRVFFRGAWSAIRSRTPHMDLPVALALAVGGLAGLTNTIRGTGELYFDTLSVLVFLLLVGRAVQIRQQRHAAATLEVLYRVTPRMAHRLVDGGFAEVPADVLEAGDIVRVMATQTVPADGVVVAGRSTIDAQVLTGEPRPVAVRPGASVAAGTVNLGATLQIRVEAVGEHTRMGHVLQLVEDAAAERPPIVALADRIGGWFVVVVLLLAAATALGWLAAEPTVAVDHAVALLIVACPCALALATPLAIAVALGRAARAKILVKGGDVLQRLATPGTIWLDKTGTLTEGRMAVMDIAGARSVAPLVGALEAHSAHPIARALVTWAAAEGAGSLACDVEQSAAGGIRGVVDGSTV
ncbi:MAG: heavy metal translocating P-type ATPase metal-binding domain-containing protein, partial [Myxococcota bacterium]